MHSLEIQSFQGMQMVVQIEHSEKVEAVVACSKIVHIVIFEQLVLSWVTTRIHFAVMESVAEDLHAPRPLTQNLQLVDLEMVYMHV